jgi:Glycoside hydrolase family 5 C-terminal domain
LSVWSKSDLPRHQSRHFEVVEPISVDEMTTSMSNSSDQSRSISPVGSVDSSTALMNKSYVEASSAPTNLGFSFPHNPSLHAGSRALEAFVRPAAIVVAGIPRSSGFNLRTCTFSLHMTPFEESPPEDAPTEIFIPEYFSNGFALDVNVSSGRWTLHRSAQVLQWWHCGKGEQSLHVSSEYKLKGIVLGSESWQDCWAEGNCKIM